MTLLMVDRSTIESFFTPGRAQGLQLNYLTEDWQFTADVSVDFSGASIFMYGVWRMIDPGVSRLNNANQCGFVLQCGVFISDTVELTARV